MKITYSMHLVLLTDGWHGGGGLRKIGSFTTIRALSSELQHKRRKQTVCVKQRKAINLQGFQISIYEIQITLCYKCFPHVEDLLSIQTENQCGCLHSDGGETPRAMGSNRTPEANACFNVGPIMNIFKFIGYK